MALRGEERKSVGKVGQIVWKRVSSPPKRRTGNPPQPKGEISVTFNPQEKRKEGVKEAQSLRKGVQK